MTDVTENRLLIGSVVPSLAARSTVAAIEQTGVDSMWCGGHVLGPRQAGECIVRLASLVAQTERVRVGSAIVLAALYHPVLLARQLSDLQVRSGGRLTVGVGAGGEFPREFEALGVPMRDRGARLNETMDVLRALWSGEAVEYEGDHLQIRGVQLHQHPPLASSLAPPGGYPSPPLLVSGRQRAALRRAALRGDGFMPYLVSPRRYAEARAEIEAVAVDADRRLDDFEWAHYAFYCLGRTSTEAVEDATAALTRAYGSMDPAVVRGVVAVGTIDEVVERLSAFAEAGARHLILAPATRRDFVPMLSEIVPAVRSIGAMPAS